MTARGRRPKLTHGKAGKRKPHTHGGRGADARWLDTVAGWPDLGTGAAPDGVPAPLPGPGGGGKGKLKGEAA